MTDQPAPLGARAVLRIPDYRRLWAAQGVSDIGDALTSLTLLIVVTRLTGSTAALAAMAIALAVPAIVVGPIAGVFVDRWDRRRVMLASDLIRAGLVLGFILVASTDRLWLMYAIAVAHATVGTFFTPSRMALIPRVVPREGLMAANSLNQMTRVLASVAGSALAGIIVGIADVSWPAFTIDALTFLLSFGLVLRVRTSGRVDAPAHDEPASGGVFASLKVGLAIVGRSPVLLGTMIAAGVTMLGLGAVNVLFVPLMIRDLQVPATWLGAVDGAQTLSMILAAGLVATIATRLRPTMIIVVGLAGIAVFIGLVAGVTSVWQVVALLFAVGWFVTPLEASIGTIIQTATRDRERGRVAATLHSVMAAASVLSMAMAGVFGDLLTIRTVFILAGVVVGIAAVVAWLMFRGVDLAAVTVDERAQDAPAEAVEAVETAA
jgi:MFS transporter, DHA3 family, macrolide efflux protein